MKSPDIANLILKTIETQVQSAIPTQRFWGKFIVSLGKLSPTPYDFLSQSDPNIITFNYIQAEFILRSLIVSLVAFSRSLSVSTTKQDFIQPIRKDSRAIFSQEMGTHQNPAHSTTPLPCSMNETEDEITSVSSSATEVAWSYLMNYLEQHGISGAGVLGRISDKINALSAFGQLIYSYQFLKMDFSLEDGGTPLVRTKHTQQTLEQLQLGDYDEKRHLAAKVYFDAGNGQLLNCLRNLMATALGVDIGVPQNGLIKGVNVQWSIITGGPVYNNTMTSSGFVTLFDYKDPQGTPTNDKGEARVGIGGVPQKYEIPEIAPPIQKQAEIEASVSRTDQGSALSTILFGGASVGLELGVSSTVISLITQMLGVAAPLRRIYDMPVTDWANGISVDSQTISFSYPDEHASGQTLLQPTTLCLKSSTDGTNTTVLSGISKMVVSGTQTVTLFNDVTQQTYPHIFELSTNHGVLNLGLYSDSKYSTGSMLVEFTISSEINGLYYFGWFVVKMALQQTADSNNVDLNLQGLDTTSGVDWNNGSEATIWTHDNLDKPFYFGLDSNLSLQGHFGDYCSDQ